MDNLPSRDRKDAIHAITKAVAGMVPVAGSALSVLLETVFAPPLERRREQWMARLGSVVQDLQESVAGLTLERLAANDVFISLAAQATQAALRTHQEEKLDALAAAVYNSVAAAPPAEDLQLMYLRFVDELTPWHLRLAAFLNGPEEWMLANKIADPGLSIGGVDTVIEHCFSALRGRRDFYQQLVRDLQTRGLIHQGQFLGVTMTGHGLLSPRTTDIGKEFIRFIARGAA